MAQSTINRKTALVTGATGFIGGNLVNALIEKGYAVSCLVRNSSDTRSLRKLPVQLIVGNLDNPAAIRKAITGRPVVFHIAGLTKARSREHFFHVNRTGTSRLLEVLAAADAPPIRFVHASSLAAAGPSPHDKPRTEEDDANPVSWYGESKLESEKEVLKHTNTFPVTILRPSAVYGPGDKDILLIFRMIQKGCLFTPGRQQRLFSLIHVRDLVRAFIKAAEIDTPSGEIFFISRPDIYTWEIVGHAIAQELGKRFRHISFPQWLALAAGMAGNVYSILTGNTVALNVQKVREILQPGWTCNTEKSERLLGFNPTIGLQGGIHNTVQWYQQQGWL